MSLAPGDRIGPYQVISAIGAGGMGVVYRARDTRLQRDVAIKVLPDAVASDAERLARFEREAQALAALNHPHIAQVYGFEGRAIVMEFVEGHTLSQAVANGPLPIDEALSFARQIASALEAAHDRGIVHRDLKPDNVKVSGATVKVLDFGLAKITAPEAGSDPGSLANSPTITSRGTEAGLILGTAAYMSPEQARGKPVDRRADVWAFGVVLAEMISGQRLFKGEDVSETLASVLAREPDLSRLPASTPAPVRRLIARCLEKDPAKRLRHIGDAVRHLDEELNAPANTANPARAPLGCWLPWATTLALAFAGVAYGVSRAPAPADASIPVALAIPPPDGLQFAASSMAVSPDGRRIAFVAGSAGANRRLMIRQLDRLEAEEVPNPSAQTASHPAWSPDGSRLAFGAQDGLRILTMSDGGVMTIAKMPAGGIRGLAWNDRGDILVGQLSGALLRVSERGGEFSNATTLAAGHVGHSWPQFLPGGNDFLVEVTASEKPGTYRGSLGGAGLTFVTASDRGVKYVPPGFLLFLQNAKIVARTYDAATGALGSTAIPFAEGVVGFVTAGFPVSVGGPTMVWLSSVEGTAVPSLVDRSGNGPPPTATATTSGAPSVSRDGRWLAVHRVDLDAGTADIWLRDLNRGTERRLTTEAARDQAPTISPDGRRVAFASTAGGAVRRDLFVVDVDSADAKPSLVLKDHLYKTPTDWSRDGEWLLYTANDSSAGTASDLHALRLADRTTIPVTASQFDEGGGHFSPDGKWVAFSSDETGRPQVYLQTFPARSQRTVVSINGGTWPTWRSDGRELYFLREDDALMAVDVSLGPDRVIIGEPRMLFRSSIGGDRTLRNYYDVAQDGRFLIMAPAQGPRARPMTVIVNWAERLGAVRPE